MSDFESTFDTYKTFFKFNQMNVSEIVCAVYSIIVEVGMERALLTDMGIMMKSNGKSMNE